ncbi:hypothetical protein OIU84_017438 [Salix udensis]|uniref:GED domain-containing protein n=1 Tax=Salix udensis TaxID=889485 RepID=A0AAD6PLS2_9ROSI|nr:hypothetical protein OIU84_017438 [Salix udensis]
MRRLGRFGSFFLLGYTKKQEERHFCGVITLETAMEESLSGCVFSFGGEYYLFMLLKVGTSTQQNGTLKIPILETFYQITSKVPYKTVLKSHSVVVLKAESMDDKVEWMNKISKVAQPSKGGQMRGVSPEGGPALQESLSDGYLKQKQKLACVQDSMARRPVDPEEELRWMSQKVRGYVEAVLNSLAANVPQFVLCQVEKAKEDMLNQLYSSISPQGTARIEEMRQEDKNVKHRRERYQKQSSLLSKLTHQLSIHDNRAAATASSWRNGDGADEAAVVLHLLTPKFNALESLEEESLNSIRL